MRGHAALFVKHARRREITGAKRHNEGHVLPVRNLLRCAGHGALPLEGMTSSSNGSRVTGALLIAGLLTGAAVVQRVNAAVWRGAGAGQ